MERKGTKRTAVAAGRGVGVLWWEAPDDMIYVVNVLFILLFCKTEKFRSWREGPALARIVWNEGRRREQWAAYRG